MKVSISSLSECAMSVFLGDEISIEANRLLNIAKNYLESHPFIGMKEVVLTYHSISIFYDPLLVYNEIKSSPSQFLKKYLTALPWNDFEKINDHYVKEVITIPVKYGGGDLDLVAEILNLSHEEIISIHSSMVYQVFMIGFLPGFPYMGVLDSKLHLKRKSEPSSHIPSGSVAIANMQTGIYPTGSPGGWYVLGKTEIKMYDKNRKQRSFFKAGDRVIFKPI